VTHTVAPCLNNSYLRFDIFVGQGAGESTLTRLHIYIYINVLCILYIIYYIPTRIIINHMSDTHSIAYNIISDEFLFPKRVHRAGRRWSVLAEVTLTVRLQVSFISWYDVVVVAKAHRKRIIVQKIVKINTQLVFIHKVKFDVKMNERGMLLLSHEQLSHVV